MKRALPLFALAWAAPAAAHVKWFGDFDLSQSPRAIDEVTGGFFLALLALSLVAGYVCFALDRRWQRLGAGAGAMRALHRLEPHAGDLVRYAVGAYFFLMWAGSQVSGEPVFLTPELRTHQAVVPWIQLAIYASALSRRTLPLMGAGIVVLYFDAAWNYGLYHLLDYPVFLGLAYFLAAMDAGDATARRDGYAVLYATTSLTLLWGAIEKFAYPDRFYPLLERYPDLLLGLSPSHYVTLAGFVEFNLTYLMFTAASPLARLVALGLDSVFVLASFRFGWMDAVGHLPFIVVLLVLVIRGPQQAGRGLLLPELSVPMEAYVMTALYLLSMAVMFSLYYGLHFLAYL